MMSKTNFITILRLSLSLNLAKKKFMNMSVYLYIAANKTNLKPPVPLVIPTLVDPEKEKQIGTKKMLLTTVLHGQLLLLLYLNPDPVITFA